MRGQVLTVVSLLLSGCSVTYYNPHITDVAALERQRIIDEGYCTRVATGSVPMPEVRHYQSGVQNYQISGSVRTYGVDGYSANSYYSGSVTAYPSSGDAFSAGMANGMNMGAALRAGQERKQVMQGCMYSLGWTTDKRASALTDPTPTKNRTQGEEFFEMALTGAEAGDPQMQTRIASAYMEGKDAPKDLDQAIRWLDKASAQGYSEATFQLAYIYAGQVDPRYADQQMMLLKIQKAAEQGEGMAQSMLGTMYYSGSNGLSKDLGKAVEWYMKACENNDATGFLGMGSLYALGQGVEQDPIQAHRFFIKAEELGNAEAAQYRQLLEEHMTEAQLREARGLTN